MGAELGRLGPYELTRELGRGGVGIVFEARHPGMGRPVALKVLHGALPGRVAEERFALEAAALRRLTHAHIVLLLDAAILDGRSTMTMELIGGGSLASALRAFGPLTVPEAAALGAKVADALAHAHARGILHRDIKPANILLTEEGEPLLSDFGLARDEHREGAALSATGQVLGTLAYMPPEQLRGETARLDARADIYALGATLYEAVTRRPPFEAESEMQLLGTVLVTPPASIMGRVEGSGAAELDVILSRCLAKAPEDRILSAQALAEDLRRVAAGAAIATRPFGRIERARHWARRHRRGLSVALPSAVLLAGLGLAGLVGLAAHRWSSQAAAQEARALADRDRARAEAAEQAALVAVAAAREARAESQALRAQAQASLERAEAAERGARERLGQLRELAQVAITDYAEALTALPRSEPAQQLLVTRLCAYLEAMSEAAEEPDLVRELARAWRRAAALAPERARELEAEARRLEARLRD